ncbi:MAG TPA: ABC transporter permease subunit [Chloroflexia bacterium]|nr:ABC transporter permease subunit [Chloroflexia bacterium]
MSSTSALFRKEFVEQWRTSKIFIMAAAFFVLGMSGPITTKFLPDLIKNSANSSGLQITVTKTFTAADYLLSFFNQMNSLPILVLILVAMGTIAGERERGTHIFVLTKPVSRTQFIVIKFLTYLAVLTGVVLLTAAGALYYTLLLSDSGQVLLGPFALITLSMFSYMSLILAIVIFFSSLFKSAIAAGGASFLVYVVISIVTGLLPDNIRNYLPMSFQLKGLERLSGLQDSSPLIIQTLVGLALAAVVIVVACVVAEKREM